MKICLTGAAGYVGSFLAQRLIQAGYEVLLIDNYFIPSHLTSINNIPITRKDIRDNIDLSEYDVLVHLAAISGINKCNESPSLANDVNYNGTVNLLKTFRGRTVFASTSAVYGEAKSPIIDEAHPIAPLCEYGKSKLKAEKAVEGTDNYIIFRFSNIYGKGITWKRTVTDNFIDKALNGETIEIHGDGKQRRDFVNINDVVVAYWQAIHATTTGTFNIGGNEELSINEIATLVSKTHKRLTGKDVLIKRIEASTGRQWKDFFYSFKYANMMLNYDPLYSVGDEIRERIRAGI